MSHRRSGGHIQGHIPRHTVVNKTIRCALDVWCLEVYLLFWSQLVYAVISDGKRPWPDGNPCFLGGAEGLPLWSFYLFQHPCSFLLVVPVEVPASWKTLLRKSVFHLTSFLFVWSLGFLCTFVDEADRFPGHGADWRQ